MWLSGRVEEYITWLQGGDVEKMSHLIKGKGGRISHLAAGVYIAECKVQTKERKSRIKKDSFEPKPTHYFKIHNLWTIM